MRILCFLFVTLVCAFSSEVSLAHSDFVERSINFLIFVLIFWYFGAGKIKEIFTSRTKSISESFQRVQEEEQKIKREKEKAKFELEEAKQKAQEIIALAKRESYMIAQKFEDRLDREIKSINLAFEQKIAQEEKTMVEEEVYSVLQKFEQHLDVSQNNDYYGEVLCKGLRK